MTTPTTVLTPMLSATTMVAARALTKTFVLHPQGGIRLPVLHGVDLDVGAGECVALTGPSGAGKSTLLRCLFANYAPTSGSIVVRHDDEIVDLTTASPFEIIELRTHTIGWVSQFLRVIPRVPTIDIVSEPVVAQGVSPADGRERAAAILRRLNVPERLWSLAPATFSGGEQQRVNVARGLVAAHRVLLVDEPTASLDPANCDVVVDLLNEARTSGIAVVGIFHDADVRARLATRTFAVEPVSSEPDAADHLLEDRAS
jgi:alpha-D-ribose 1-methylphosphonate 5-triphosphate synthase subunit PhnL